MSTRFLISCLVMVMHVVDAATSKGCFDREGHGADGGVASRMIGIDADLPTVSVRLWRADAIVLFDWLMSTDLDTVPVTHPAQKQALADLLSRFEWAADSDITASTADEIAAAQRQIGKHMGW